MTALRISDVCFTLQQQQNQEQSKSRFQPSPKFCFPTTMSSSIEPFKQDKKKTKQNKKMPLHKGVFVKFCFFRSVAVVFGLILFPNLGNACNTFYV